MHAWLGEAECCAGPGLLESPSPPVWGKMVKQSLGGRGQGPVKTLLARVGFRLNRVGPSEVRTGNSEPKVRKLHSVAPNLISRNEDMVRAWIEPPNTVRPRPGTGQKSWAQAKPDFWV